MQTDVVLFKAKVSSIVARSLDETALQVMVGKPLSAVRVVVQGDLDQESDGVLCYAYAKPEKPRKFSKKQHAQMARRWRKLSGDKKALTCRLKRALDCPGASSKANAKAHYVVQTDTDKGWFNEIIAWYDTEHMPGLAAVPGTVHAARFINLDKGPKSFACYDLEHEDVLGSPPWLDVRGTAWSSHCRPHFKNTLRDMFKVLV